MGRERGRETREDVTRGTDFPQVEPARMAAEAR